MKKRLIGIGTVNISKKGKRFVNKILDSGRLTQGPYMRKFEKAFAKCHNSKFAIFCNSGTSALQVAVQALKETYGWKDGDEILVPAITFIASSNVIIQNGLRPVFVDVDPLYYGIDPSKLEEKITGRTKAIMPVHLFGQPCDMDPIINISKQYGLKIIEDSCETMFAKYKGRSVGSWGEISCFSTYVAHLIVAGVGGLATTNDPELAILMKSLFNHGRDGIYISIDDDNNKSSKELFKIVNKRFSFIRVGYSYRLTELEAALALDALGNKKRIIERRQKNAQRLISGLKQYEKYLQLPKVREQTEHVFMMFPIVITDEQIKRDDLVFYLEKFGIETRYMMPLLNQPIYRKIFGDIENQYPIAKKINKNGFFIGCHQDLTNKDIDYTIKIFNSFFEGYFKRKKTHRR